MGHLQEEKSKIPRERTKATEEHWDILEEEGDYTRRLRRNEITDARMRNMESEAMSEPEVPLRTTTLRRVLEALTKGGHGDDHPIPEGQKATEHTETSKSQGLHLRIWPMLTLEG